MPMSPGPHSANAIPGTRVLASTLARARTFSILRPSKSSPRGLSGQGSAVARERSTASPPTGAARSWPPGPRRPTPHAGPTPGAGRVGVLVVDRLSRLEELDGLVHSRHARHPNRVVGIAGGG